ncbi:hypothetical protein DF186_14760, partial [Enterococcus hirae]
MNNIQQTQIKKILINITNTQNEIEQLKNTPLPFQYQLLPIIFTHLFYILLPIKLIKTLNFTTPLNSTITKLIFITILQINNNLTNPFTNNIHNIPL